MDRTIEHLEAHRRSLQDRLDAAKTTVERNHLGQFATPSALARNIIDQGLSLLPDRKSVRFLDPAIGTGSFYSALCAAQGDAMECKLEWARGFEVDPHYGVPARELWAGTSLDITLADFTRQTPPMSEAGRANLLICNPPYVRHHHLPAADKHRLQALARQHANTSLSGLAGLYCYFLTIAHAWLSDEGIGGWLIPSEFMDVNYGQALKAYLLREVTLLGIHRFEPTQVQFDDALVSSAVVWFRKSAPAAGHRVRFSQGGTLAAPQLVKKVGVAALERTAKWTRFPKGHVEGKHRGHTLADLFAIKRGLATGDNRFFIVDEQQARRLDLPRQFLRPVLPSTRYIESDEIVADEEGIPLLEKRLFLIDCDRPLEEIERHQPALWRYLVTGLDSVALRYLCRARRVWYAQEKRPAAPIVCTYLGRSDHGGRPFRFLLNGSSATATNVYLMLYPQPALAQKLALEPRMIRVLWEALNAIPAPTLLGNGRVYGGGLHKLEPRELGNVPADHLAALAGL